MIKLFGMDVDGTMTDGRVWCSEKGEELLCFSRDDGYGIELLRQRGIKTFVLTGENNQIVRKRCEKLKIDLLYTGATDKLKCLREIMSNTGIGLEEIAYIGNDENDLPVLNVVGIAGVVGMSRIDGHPDLASIENLYITSNPGGNGAIRDFIEYCLDVD